MQVAVITFTEWDLDLTGRVFVNLEKAQQAARETVEANPYLMEDYGTFDEIVEEGLITFSEMPVEGFGDTVVPFTFTIKEPDYDDCEPRGGVELTRDDGEKPKSLFRVYEGEPEDMTLGRDLGDCMSVETLLELGHSLALEGKGIEVTVKRSLNND